MINQVYTKLVAKLAQESSFGGTSNAGLIRWAKALTNSQEVGREAMREALSKRVGALTDSQEVDLAFDWAAFRKDSGVNPSNTIRVYNAFRAGWIAGLANND